MCLHNHNCYSFGSDAVDNATASTCNVYKLKYWLAGHLDKGSVQWRGAGHVNKWGSVCWECRLGVQLFNSSLKLTNHKCHTTKLPPMGKMLFTAK